MKKTDLLISKTLLAWYDRCQRILPWRKHPDPYRVWISEIMLQQTQVDIVIPYYHRFLKRFPDVAALAEAPLDDVLKAWENLGYYARARNLRQTALILVKKFNGKLPDTWEAIITLPGIGNYTAGAILSIAFGKAVPAVDGNVRRVLSRLYAVREPVNQRETQKRLHALAASLIPKTAPGSFNQALMDLGAMICVPKSPACADCPLRIQCKARQFGLQDLLPMPEKKPATPHERVTAAVIFNRQGQVMIVRRPARGLLASLWKFPGSIVKEKELLEEGLTRTVREELGIRIRAGKPLASVNHAYTHFRITLTAFRCFRRSGRPRALACQEWRWASPDDLENLTFSKADRAVISIMKLTAYNPPGRLLIR
ncbi:MAG: A/G-specific adenine glycosylase [Pseudomonadota bacterium]